jgi:hypothetical protein
MRRAVRNERALQPVAVEDRPAVVVAHGRPVGGAARRDEAVVAALVHSQVQADVVDGAVGRRVMEDEVAWGESVEL